MPQLLYCILIFSLIFQKSNIQAAFIDVNWKTTRSLNYTTPHHKYLSINSPTLRTGSLHSPPYNSISRHKFTRSFNPSTLRTQTLDSSRLRTRTLQSPPHNTINRHKLTRISNSSILRTRTLDSSTLRTRTLPSPLYNSINIHKLTRSFNPSTLKTQTLDSSTLRTRTLQSPRLNLQMLNSPTIRTPTLNSPPLLTDNKFNHVTINTYKLNLHSVTLNDPNLEHKIYDEGLELWLKETIVSLSNKTKADPGHIDGLKHYKLRINRDKHESRKRSEKSVDDNIIPKDIYEVSHLLAPSTSAPTFDDSFTNAAAKRLKAIQSDYLNHKLKEETSKSARRQYQFHISEDPNAIDRILVLMEQFIFESQKRMILSQMLKNKYVENVKFKIGYVFAMLRTHKQQQLRIYSSMHYWRFYKKPEPDTKYDRSIYVSDNMYYLSLYEKLMRLDLDIISLVKFLWDLEKERVRKKAIELTKFPKRLKVTPRITSYTRLFTMRKNKHQYVGHDPYSKLKYIKPGDGYGTYG